MEVRKTRIIGTRCVVYSAWEPSSLLGKHGTVTTNAYGDWIGRVGTRAISPEVEKMKGGSPERCAAVDAHHKAQYEEAYAAIIARYPEAAEGRRDMGEIEIWEKA